MSDLDFARFFRVVHGYNPFPWQERLAARVLETGWPDAIDVPTGCGKTSVLDVAVFALAVQAPLPPGERNAPLRTFFVVDRRLVVDDVSGHAFHLREAIESRPELAWVRESLLRFRGARPLDVSVMRGGMYRSDTWADSPNQPVICVSTVDQVGSRLLFRGYGLSPQMRPVHAGLVGNDSLVIVDEAHLSGPFLDTLGAVRRYHDWRERKIVPGIRFVEMSATRRETDESAKVERLNQDDYRCEDLRTRLDAPKIADLRETTSLAETAVKDALRIARRDTGVAGIVLNTVAGARDAFEILRSKTADDCILLTGRIRPYDRDRLLAEFGGRMKAQREPRDGKRLFVVATQTIEVGADLDFDALVTEAAPLDSLRQRFGRLNRLGKGPGARAVILKPKRGKESEWIYGAASDKTWEWLKKHGGDQIDFGVRAMQDLFEAKGDQSLLVERSQAPVMLPAHVDAWAETNPEPQASPDVAPFLHGCGAHENADVQIVWRADLDDIRDPWHWIDRLSAAPPMSSEALPVPFWTARRWLQYKPAAVADLEGTAAPEQESEGRERPFLIWRGPEERKTEAWCLRPGDTVVVRSSEGGCDRFGWNPDSTELVPDIGDVSANVRVEQGGGRYRVRVVPQILFPNRDSTGLRSQTAAYLARADEESDETAEEIKSAILAAAGYKSAWGRPKAYGAGWLLVESRWVPRAGKGAVWAPPDETDQDDTASQTRTTTLREHTDGVVRKARVFSAACGVGDALLESIALAARMHDEGKQDERFQYMLSPEATGEPLAKCDGVSHAEWSRRQQDAAYPAGARHEFASVALAREFGAWPKGCDAELALYLIGAHHGYGRPLPPVWNDDGHTIRAAIEGRSVAVTDVHRVARLDSGWVDRYEDLTRKYGWWGLAYLEAILRRADCVRSREEQEGK